jgi:hypothetical protein
MRRSVAWRRRGGDEEEEEEEVEEVEEEEETSKRIRSAYPSGGAAKDSREPAPATRVTLCRACEGDVAAGGGVGVLVPPVAAAAAAAAAAARAVGVAGHSPESPI